MKAGEEMIELTNLADPRNKSEVGSGTGPSTSGSKDESYQNKNDDWELFEN